MSKILFLNQPSVGHVNTLLSIAVQMKDDGHDVCFLVPGLPAIKTNIQIIDTGSAIPEKIKRNGLVCEVMPLPLSVVWSGIGLPLKSGYAEVTYALNILLKGIEHYTGHILKFIETYQPDVLVTDFAFPAASLAADIAKLPYVTIYHSGLPFRGKGIPPFGSGLPIDSDNEALASNYIEQENRTLNNFDRCINRARQKFGLPPAEPDLFRRPYSPWLNLITSADSIEAPRDNLTPTTFFIGTCLGKRVEMDEFSFDFLDANKFKIYISLGTVFNKKPDVFLKIMRALDLPDYQVIVSAGGAYQTLKNSAIPSNAHVFKSVPQVGLLPKIDLFITHGGNNSTMEAMSCGKPVIVMPIGGEQADNASRAVYLGVGKKVDIAKFSEKQILEVVAEIRTNPRFQERAMTLMHGLKSTQGVVTASRCIAWVAQEKQPLCRKTGIPLTITPDHLAQLLI